MPPATRSYQRDRDFPHQPPPGTSHCHMMAVVHTVACYHRETTDHIQRDIKKVEKEVEVIRDCTSNEELCLEYTTLLPNPGSTRGHLTLYHKYLDFLWMSKLIMGKALTERGEAYNEILL